MKKQIQIIGLAVIIISLTFCDRSVYNSNSIAIKDYSQKEIDLDINDQKDGDAYVFKTWFVGEGYKVVMFHDFSGELQMYDCFYGSEKEFNEAKLSWKNDTTLSVTLINTELKKKDYFEFFGNGNSSGMSIEDE